MGEATELNKDRMKRVMEEMQGELNAPVEQPVARQSKLGAIDAEQ
jgi:hypothetical protein